MGKWDFVGSVVQGIKKVNIPNLNSIRQLDLDLLELADKKKFQSLERSIPNKFTDMNDLVTNVLKNEDELKFTIGQGLQTKKFDNYAISVLDSTDPSALKQLKTNNPALFKRFTDVLDNTNNIDGDALKRVSDLKAKIKSVNDGPEVPSFTAKKRKSYESLTNNACTRNPLTCAGTIGAAAWLTADHVGASQAKRACIRKCVPLNWRKEDDEHWAEKREQWGSGNNPFSAMHSGSPGGVGVYEFALDGIPVEILPNDESTLVSHWGYSATEASSIAESQPFCTLEDHNADLPSSSNRGGCQTKCVDTCEELHKSAAEGIGGTIEKAGEMLDDFLTDPVQFITDILKKYGYIILGIIAVLFVLSKILG